MSAQPKTLDELLAARAHIEAQLAEGKAYLAVVNQAINETAGSAASLGFQRNGQTSGTVKFALDAKIYKAEIEKTVKWDSDMLQQVAGSLPFELARDTFKVTYSVTETVFKTLADDVQAKLMPARTVKYSEPKISAVA